MRALIVLTGILCTLPAWAVSEAEFQALKQRVAILEQKWGMPSQAQDGTRLREQRIRGQKEAARARMRKDGQTFDIDALKEIENLYQVANKEWKSEQARHSLAKLITQYDNANRTGCAVLYMGQMHDGDIREKYYTMAIEYHSDCYFGNGASVGGLARLYLARHFQAKGNASAANSLLAQIRADYPDALNHRGEFLVDLMGR